jgi:hypothetical protein
MKIYADKVGYYSRGDEDRFFHGLYNNPAYKSVKGYNTILHIEIDARRLTREALYDLVSLYYRYMVDMQELLPILTPRNRGWLELGLPHMLELILNLRTDDRML